MKKVFVIKVKKEEAGRGFTVPRHPEFMLEKEISQNEWSAYNRETKEKVVVRKKEKGQFVEYIIS